MEDKKKFYEKYKALRKEGKSESEIADIFGVGVFTLRQMYLNASHAIRLDLRNKCLALKVLGKSDKDISESCGMSVDTVRALMLT